MKYLDKENKIEILFEDNHLLIVNKPAGLLTQPNDTNEPSLEEIAKGWIKKNYQKPGSVFLHCVHRIDKPVSGIVVFARTSKCLSRLMQQVRDRKIKRTYVALVQGHLSKKQGKLCDYLVHGSHRALVVKKDDPVAKEALLTYKVIESKQNGDLIEICLITGRYHQIRAQFSHIRHPIVGDQKYGADGSGKKICLHQMKISFLHPTLKSEVSIQTGLPVFFKDVSNDTARLYER